MAHISKKAKRIREQLGESSIHSPEDAIKLLQKLSDRKFEESLDLVVKLGIDARKGDEMVRGVVALPCSSGKEARVAVFADGEVASQAKDAGADTTGMEDLVNAMEQGDLNYDVVIATPAAMKLVGRLGRVLGPKGLMPNPKDGTVTERVAEAVKTAKAGQARIRNEKAGIIHCSLGKLRTDAADLAKNFYAVMHEVQRLKPKSSKGVYLRRVVLSSTMGPGLEVNPERN